MSEAESYSRLAAVYDELVVDDAYPQWATFLHGLWRHDESGVRDILDVCCGTGLMAAELAGLGYRVVGTDASVEMLERARELLGPDAELWAMALPDLPVGTTFDAVISTFDGLNYVSPDDFALSVGRLAEVVRPGGWLCFDLHTDAMMQFTMDNPEVDGEADGHSYQISTQVSRGEPRVRHRDRGDSEQRRRILHRAAPAVLPQRRCCQVGPGHRRVLGHRGLR